MTYAGYWGLSTLSNTLGLTEFYSTIDSKNGLMRKSMSLATWNRRLEIEEYMSAKGNFDIYGFTVFSNGLENQLCLDI